MKVWKMSSAGWLKMKRDDMEEKTMEYVCGCGNKMMKKKTELKGFDVKAWKCEKCGEEILDPNDVDRVIRLKCLIS